MIDDVINQLVGDGDKSIKWIIDYFFLIQSIY
jgi:hypothetical protein